MGVCHVDLNNCTPGFLATKDHGTVFCGIRWKMTKKQSLKKKWSSRRLKLGIYGGGRNERKGRYLGKE